jgi:hypothetical protein
MIQSSHKQISTFTRLMAVCVWVCVAANLKVQAEDSLELIELQSNLKASASRVRELESRLKIAAQQTQTAAAAMASANKHAAESLERYEALRSAVSGVGVAGIEGDANGESLQQRLLVALAELKASRERAAQLETSLVKVAEYLNAPDGKVDAQNAVNAALSMNGAASLAAMTVADVKSDAGMVVIQTQGMQAVHAGAKVTINTQSGEKVAGFVVEVRENVACAILDQSLAVVNRPAVGDSVDLSINQ